MTLRQKAVSRISRTKTGRTLLASRRYRSILSAAAAFAVHLLYALYHGILGALNRSLWLIALCAFYGVLAMTRFAAVFCGRSRQKPPSAEAELFVMRVSGVLLGILGLVLAAVNYISLTQNIAARYEEILMITIATYTFYKIAMSVVKAVKQHRDSDPLLKTMRNISYAEAAASILTLQRSMLNSFGSMDSGRIFLMNAITGAAICLFVLMLGLSMIIKSKERN